MALPGERMLFDACPDSLVTVDRELTVTDVNATMCAMTGVSRHELVGTPFPGLFGGDDLNGAAENLRETLLRGPVHDRELILRTSHRPGVPVSLNATPYEWAAAGHASGVFITLREVTESRRFEQEVLRLNNLLRDEALEAARLRAEFVATMSHEVRTSMNGVMGLTELLLGGDLDPDERRYAEGIRTAGSALITLLSNVLDLSKIEAGQSSLEHTEVVLVEFMEQALDVVTGSAWTKGLSLGSYVSPDLPEVLVGDPVRLRQVLLNLLDNAVKFTGTGGVRALVRPADGGLPDPEDSEVRVCFEVTDTGVGMSRMTIDRLFQRYAQAVPDPRGTGLGLTISRQLVELMGGSLDVHSEAGRGSSFLATVVLRRPGRRTESTGRPDLAGQRVLLVGADDTVSATLGRYLSDWGARVDTAATADEASALVREAGPAVGLVIVAATSAGPQAALAAAIDPVPVILLGREDGARHRNGREAKSRAVLPSPVHRVRLREALARVWPGAGVDIRAPGGSPEPVAPEPDLAAGAGAVLLVEDDEVNQIAVAGLVRRHGYHVDVATDGEHAVMMVGQRPYQLVLMDLLMAGMDGCEAAREMRQREDGSRRTPIVAITASAKEKDRQRCFDAGMDGYLVKPFTPDDIAGVLARWIQREN